MARAPPRSVRTLLRACALGCRARTHTHTHTHMRTLRNTRTSRRARRARHALHLASQGKAMSIAEAQKHSLERVQSCRLLLDEASGKAAEEEADFKALEAEVTPTARSSPSPSARCALFATHPDTHPRCGWSVPRRAV